MILSSPYPPLINLLFPVTLQKSAHEVYCTSLYWYSVHVLHNKCPIKETQRVDGGLSDTRDKNHKRGPELGGGAEALYPVTPRLRNTQTCQSLFFRALVRFLRTVVTQWDTALPPTPIHVWYLYRTIHRSARPDQAVCSAVDNGITFWTIYVIFHSDFQFYEGGDWEDMRSYPRMPSRRCDNIIPCRRSSYYFLAIFCFCGQVGIFLLGSVLTGALISGFLGIYISICQIQLKCLFVYVMKTGPEISGFMTSTGLV